MLRLADTAPDHDDATEDSVTLAEAARRMGCSQSTVRELLELGELTGHRVGKCLKPRGVRIHAAAIRRYKARNTMGGAPRAANDEAPAERMRPPNPRAAEAKRRLRALGVL